ncbi:MAG: heparin lyase I family protein [Gemmatimonadetes bacterium]|nr:heparin lyase I family protein [Gemmatimonadota bacterium]
MIDAAGKYAVAMTVEPGAAKTSPNTSYPRCEHREMQQTSSGNNDKANWTIDSNDHDFSGFSRIMTLPPAKPGVCINQLHDQDDDTVMIKSMALSGKIAIVLDVYGTRVAVLQADFTLGREIYSRIRINNAALSVYYSQSSSGTTSATVTTSTAYTGTVTNTNPPWYHKFGCYAQSNDSTDTTGTKCLVYVRDWKQWHTGWPTPVTGNYAGPGGSGGTGAPIVSAGADATVAPGATFSRTGQVVGSGITAQGWRVVGTGASTTDQSTAAGKLGWGVPSAESDEFNYTGAPDPSKWSVYNGAGHGGNGVRSPQRVTVANGVMTLTGLAGSANTAGLEHKLDRQYGKWEFRAKSYYTSDPAAPGDKDGGYHPVGILWSDHASWPLDGEYDFLENGEPGQQAAGAFLHYPSLDGSDHQIDVPDYPVDLRQWHNFAIEWTSTFIKLYVDGILWYTASGGAASDRKNIQAMSAGHLTLQLDAFQATGLIGSAMDIEWVRTYPLTPVTTNPQISSTSQVNYIVPTTPGNYTLEFFATNASGTSTDQVVVTSGTPTEGGETGGTVPVGSTTTFTEDFELGNFSRWTSVQNKSYEGSAASYNLGTTYSQKIVNQSTDHPHALRTEVRDGDTAVGSHERAELSSFGKSWNDQKDQERWYEFDIRFGDPTWAPGMASENDWFIFYQWHQPVDDGSPALAMSVHNDGKVYIEREPDSDFEFIGPLWTVRPGVWEKVVVHIKWSPNSSVGFVHVYLNGTEILPKKMCKTQYSADFNDYYVKIGTYRRSSISGTTVVMHDKLRISGP